MGYATIAEARAEGITTDTASDLRLQAALDEASRFVDQTTGWWFEPRLFTTLVPLRLDGNGTPILRLPAPAIALTSVTVESAVGVERTLDASEYFLVGAVQDTVNVRNPRLFSGPRAARYIDRTTWARGVGNVRVVGTFGFTNPDGATPPLPIRMVTIRLAMRELGLLADAAAQAERRRGEVVEEHTDGHSYKLAGAISGVSAGAWRTRITGDPAIDTVLYQWTDLRPHGGSVS